MCEVISTRKNGCGVLWKKVVKKGVCGKLLAQTFIIVAVWNIYVYKGTRSKFFWWSPQSGVLERLKM